VLHLWTQGAGNTGVLNGCHLVLISANTIRAQQLAGTADEVHEVVGSLTIWIRSRVR